MNYKNLLSITLLLIFQSQTYCKNWFKPQRRQVKDDRKPQFTKEDVDDILYGASSKVNDYTWDEIEFLSRKNKNFFIQFYNNSCSHSNNAKKQFDDLVEDVRKNPDNFFRQNNILVGKCNMQSDHHITKELGTAAPLLRYYNEGAPIEIKVHKHDWKIYINKIKEKWVNLVKTIDTLQRFDTLFQDGDIVVYTGYNHSPRNKLLISVSNELRDFYARMYDSIKQNYGNTVTEEILQKYDMELNELYFISKETRKAIRFRRAWKESRIEDWLVTMARSMTMVANPFVISHLIVNQGKAQVLFLDTDKPENDSKGLQKDSSVVRHFETALESTFSEFPGIICHKNNSACDKLEDQLMIFVDRRPQIKLIDRIPDYDNVVSYTLNNIESAESITNFINHRNTGKIAFDILSEEIPKDFNKDHTKVSKLTSESVSWFFSRADENKPNETNERLILQYHGENVNVDNLETALSNLRSLNRDFVNGGHVIDGNLSMGHIDASKNTQILFNFKSKDPMHFRLYNNSNSFKDFIKIPYNSDYNTLKKAVIDNSIREIVFDMLDEDI